MMKWSQQRKEWFSNHIKQLHKDHPERYEHVREMARRPKSEETKRKMSEAKYNVAKSDAHRKAMSNAHKNRWALYNWVQENNPEYDRNQIWEKVRVFLSEYIESDIEDINDWIMQKS